MTNLKFPDGFLWGVSTSAHQIEGGQENDFAAWEPTVAEELASSAKDRLGHLDSWPHISGEAEDPESYISGSALEHWSEYERDILLMKELNLSGFRLSVEWSRVEPEPGKFDQQALDRYRHVVETLLHHGITPMVTLYHFTNPKWFADGHDWLRSDAPELFGRFAGKVAQNLRGLVPLWVSINEPGTYLFMKYLDGNIWPAWPNQIPGLRHAWRAQRNMIKAHKLAHSAIKHHDPNAKVGMIHGMPLFKTTYHPLSYPVAKIAQFSSGHDMIRAIGSEQDFVGLNYYLRLWVQPGLKSIPNWYRHDTTGATTDFGWGIYPKGIYEITQRAKKYDLPLYITENGLADKGDGQRTQYIRDHLRWLHKSIADGADVRGYFHWTLHDNFEFSEGYWPKFGLVEVDRDTGKRTIRDSARVYSEIAKANGLDIA